MTQTTIINAAGERVKVATNPKDLLDRDHEIKVGDFVTINDDNTTVEVFVVEKIEDNNCYLCGLALTEAKDDVYTYDFIITLDKVLYLGDSFVSCDGALWNIRKKIMKTIK